MVLNSEKGQVTDYSVGANWLYAESDISEPVDVFFVAPTTYSGDEVSCSVTNVDMRRRAEWARESQATAFEQSANLFMPHYRQVDAYYTLSLSAEEKEQLMRSIPVEDILAAFRYYISELNEGRPFILAGHSQGSNCLLYLLEYLNSEPRLLEQMVCGYVIGYSVTEHFLRENQNLKYATGADDFGVICSWNTESPNVTKPNPVVEAGAIAINPINWRLDECHAAAAESLGARVEEPKGLFTKVQGLADARVDRARGVVVCSTVDPDEWESLSIFPRGVLHTCDYPFYYYDLVANVRARVESFLNKE